MTKIELKPCPFCGGKAETKLIVKHEATGCINDTCPGWRAAQGRAGTTAASWNTRPIWGQFSWYDGPFQKQAKEALKRDRQAYWSLHDTSHQMSEVMPDGSVRRVGEFTHASDASLAETAVNGVRSGELVKKTKVKELVWETRHGTYTSYTTACAIEGELYYHIHHGSSFQTLKSLDSSFWPDVSWVWLGDYTDLDSAKAACQEYFEKSILGGLES